jgi:hypothetical protein
METRAKVAATQVKEGAGEMREHSIQEDEHLITCWCRYEKVKQEPPMDALSKLRPCGHCEIGVCSIHGPEQKRSSKMFLAALRPVIEKLVEAGQAMRAENYAIGSADPQVQNWEAALEAYRKLGS